MSSPTTRDQTVEVDDTLPQLAFAISCAERSPDGHAREPLHGGSINVTIDDSTMLVRERAGAFERVALVETGTPAHQAQDALGAAQPPAGEARARAHCLCGAHPQANPAPGPLGRGQQ